MNPTTELSPYFIEPVRTPVGARGFLGEQFAPDSSLSPRDYWLIVRKHLRLVLAVVIGAITLTGVALMLMRPLYTSQALLLIERNAPQVLDIRQALPEPMMADDYDYYKTQYELLKSRTLAAHVIRDQALEADLSAQIASQGRLLQRLKDGAAALAGQLGISSGAPPAALVLDTRASVDGVPARLVDVYLKRLDIEPRTGTRLVAVAYTASDPQRAAAVANAHALAYIRQGLEMRSNANEEAQHFLESKLVELRQRVENSEAALNAYRRDKGILSLNGRENLALERLDQLSKRVNEAEAERIGLEAQQRTIQHRDFESLPAVISSELIDKLKQETAAIEVEYAGMAAQFKAGYGPLDQLHSRLEESRARLGQEVKKVVAGIESAYLTALAREQELRAKMEEQKTVVLAQNDAAVKYAILSREVDTNRQLYDSVLQRMKEMGVAADIRASNIFVVDHAEAARRPSHPATLSDLTISALLGLAAALGLALVLESLDNTFKSPDDVHRALGLPSLAFVPKFARIGAVPKLALDHGQRNGNGNGTRALRSELIVSRERFSAATEAYSALRTNILLSRAGQPPKVTLLTSALSAEGKTITAVNTAALFAAMGMRVALLDADLRRPRCHELLLGKSVAGVTEVLTGQLDLADVIQPTAVENLFLISAGTIPPNPAELIGSKSMRQVLDTLRKRFDFVFIDSAPVMMVSDSLFIAALADGTVVLIDSSNTPRAVVSEACSRLSRVGAKVLGVVLNQVDVTRPGYYYGSHSYSYGGGPSQSANGDGINHSGPAA
ncbi:MAG TPA: polysaccharide biosynthesis tyrosine autokinase [Candidatus Binataceae bacterium]|nr:polysaccharide biosynthesis tyrosine autokinase [Candidatus Binataceae bacterium]